MNLPSSLRPRGPSGRLTTGITAALVFLLAAPQAACANNYALGPQRTELPGIGEVDFVEPGVVEAKDGILDTELKVVLVTEDGKAVDCGDKPQADARYYRAYMAQGQTEPKPTGPTLKFSKGDRLRILLRNELCKTDDEHTSAGFAGNPPQVSINRNKQHGINHTNLHTHGLWVSPAGNSDNVLISVAPGTDFQFEYLIPEDHVPGTHWYHPHKHGSVATQVQTGMSGALIMTGGIDEIPAVKQARERVMVIQRFVASDRIAAIPAAATADRLRFPDDQITTVNGLMAPTIKGVAPGQTERWRIVSAMAAARLNIWVEKVRPRLGQCGASEAPDGSVPLHPIAYDGIPVAKVHAWREIRLYPGNRADLMLRFGEPGTYVICNNPRSGKPDFGPIGYVQVDQARVAPPMPIPDAFGPQYRYPSLLDDEQVAKLQRQILFSEDYGEGFPDSVRIDNKQFDPNRVDQRVPLDAKQEWVLKNDSKNEGDFHPYHIHVNPFQLVDSSDPIYSDERMKGVWLDVVGIPGSPGKGEGRGPGYVQIRSHFKRFIGLYVIHCHILSHEDGGMMQIVEVY